MVSFHDFKYFTKKGCGSSRANHFPNSNKVLTYVAKEIDHKKEDAFDPKVKREMWDQLALFHTLTRKKGRFKCSKARFLASI